MLKKKKKGSGPALANGYTLPTTTLVHYSYFNYKNSQIYKKKPIYYYLDLIIVNICHIYTYFIAELQ